METPEESFNKRIKINPETECWEWQGAVHSKYGKHPYPQFTINGKQIIATRFAYEKFIGELGKSLKVFQRCRNKLCVNPSHLYIDKFSKTDKERFEESYIINFDNGCWEWTGLTDERGYGFFRVGNKNVFAHRFSYRVYIGELEQELNVCHKCDNPKCVNPFHLFKGTQKDNLEDMFNKGRKNRSVCGTISGYVSKKCRCNACSEAWRTYHRKYIKR